MEPRVRCAELVEGSEPPRSARFGDIYHDADGAREVERVFMAPARLDARFCAVGEATMTVAELGFGTGLNFAVLAERFLRRASSGARLHFVSVERYPLGADDFADLARRRAHLSPLYRSLADDYPPMLGGWQRRFFAEGRVALSLYLGDALTGITDVSRRMSRPVEHWLLDGFAPDRNPDMWSPELLGRVAELSAEGTTACTFSAAGAVRRTLAEVGFRVQKIDQRPHKRHSTLAVFAGPCRRFHPPAGVTVVGAGLAGSCAARAFAERGIDVRLIEKHPGRATSIPVATANPRLLPVDSAEARYRAKAFHFSTAWLVRFAASRRSGALRLAMDGEPLRRLEALTNAYRDTGPWLRRVEPGEASSICALPVRRPGLLLRQVCTVDIGALIRELIGHPRIERPGADDVTQDPDRPWILCAGAASIDFDPARYLEVVPVWGQVELLRLDATPALPLIGQGIIAPHGNGSAAVGASYEHVPWDPRRASRFNLQRLDAWWRACILAPLAYRTEGLARGCRAVSSDRLPIVGPLHDPVGRPVADRFVSTGHGSHGTLSAPLAADCLASTINGEFAILDDDERGCVDGRRFLERQSRRGLRHGARPGPRSTPRTSAR